MAAPRARFRPQFEYAVKFLCTSNLPGTSQVSSSVLPGNYQTAVNIHNPANEPAMVRMKLALGPKTVTRFVRDVVGPDGLLRVDCADATRFGRFIHGVEGFLIIQSTHSLDVAAVYTAGPVGGAVASIDVEAVSGRSLQ
jgi:hypothetical protein